ncbi:MAG: hypothetical protein R3272_06505 [Candidatus Promineifilaceae bacterium]|nr:hypothetical protein [Candidatus Promineifilaceae bacterium]
MKWLMAIISGLIGSLTLTIIHETARRLLPEAPRADILGVRALEKGMLAAGKQPPTGDALHYTALGADVVVNAAYYSLVGLGGRRGAPLAGLLLGLAGGVGAVALPGPLGLGSEPTTRSPETRAMTVAWYTLAGLVAAAMYTLLGRLSVTQN